MLDVMYELPERKDIAKVSINRAVVDGKKAPVMRKRADKDAPRQRRFRKFLSNTNAVRLGR